jgi:hypothetical protein
MVMTPGLWLGLAVGVDGEAETLWGYDEVAVP